MSTRIGVDVGGTFTDLILLDEDSGQVTVGKGPSEPAAVDRGGSASRSRPPSSERRVERAGVLPARHDGGPQRAARAKGCPRRHAHDRRDSATCSRSGG